MAWVRPATGSLALALTGGVPLFSADLITFVLVDGVTTFRWTSWNLDLLADGYTFLSRAPWIKRSQWSVTRTMAVPTMDVVLSALNDSFNGGAQVKTQIHNGLFDGASMMYSRAFMATPGDTASLGTVDIFYGFVGGIELDGQKAIISCKGKNNNLNQSAPRNVYQAGCNHAFCDVGCTLLRATYTAPFAVGASPTRSIIPWAAAPGNFALYKYGTVTFTSGPNSGQSRNIAAVDATNITLAYPLYYTPSAAETFNAFQGCDKTKARCDSLGNAQHYRAFPYTPPPTTAY
jgi:uncharacterized phage protein (TIGR02218 family)